MSAGKETFVGSISSWQPIETAPKDGTHIILYWAGKVFEGMYLDNSKSMAPWQGFIPMPGQPFPLGKPTHWQPLPQPPKCKYGDPLCPCQDGDPCHYEGENPMKPPK